MNTIHVDLMDVAGYGDWDSCEQCGHYSLWSIGDYYEEDGSRWVEYDDSVSCYGGDYWSVPWDDFVSEKWPEIQETQERIVVDAIREHFNL